MIVCQVFLCPFIPGIVGGEVQALTGDSSWGSVYARVEQGQAANSRNILRPGSFGYPAAQPQQSPSTQNGMPIYSGLSAQGNPKDFVPKGNYGWSGLTGGWGGAGGTAYGGWNVLGGPHRNN